MRSSPRIFFTRLFNIDEAGFSLVEFLISSTIMLVISIPLFRALNEIQRTAGSQSEIQTVLDNTRVALQTLQRYVLQAGNDPLRLGFEAISIVSPTEACIRSDLTGSEGPGNPDKGDPDGDTNDSGENVTFRYNDRKQRLEIVHGSGPAQIIADNIYDFFIQYFDSEGLKTDTGGNVRKIVVTISGAGPLKRVWMGKQFGLKIESTMIILP